MEIEENMKYISRNIKNHNSLLDHFYEKHTKRIIRQIARFYPMQWRFKYAKSCIYKLDTRKYIPLLDNRSALNITFEEFQIKTQAINDVNQKQKGILPSSDTTLLTTDIRSFRFVGTTRARVENVIK